MYWKSHYFWKASFCGCSMFDVSCCSEWKRERITQRTTQAQNNLGNFNLFSQPQQEANRYICHVEALTHPPEVKKDRQMFQWSRPHLSPKTFRGDQSRWRRGRYHYLLYFKCHLKLLEHGLCLPSIPHACLTHPFWKVELPNMGACDVFSSATNTTLDCTISLGRVLGRQGSENP